MEPWEIADRIKELRRAIVLDAVNLDDGPWLSVSDKIKATQRRLLHLVLSEEDIICVALRKMKPQR